MYPKIWLFIFHSVFCYSFLLFIFLSVIHFLFLHFMTHVSRISWGREGSKTTQLVELRPFSNKQTSQIWKLKWKIRKWKFQKIVIHLGRPLFKKVGKSQKTKKSEIVIHLGRPLFKKVRKSQKIWKIMKNPKNHFFWGGTSWGKERRQSTDLG
jgi:hypothetical protein